jgi:uncharacterized membrane protein YqaE (UPF0057 family)
VFLVSGRRRIVLAIIVFGLVISLSKGMTYPSMSVNLTVTVLPFVGVVVELYDESGQLFDRTDPAQPPLEAALTTPDKQHIGLYIPETVLEGPTTVQIYLNGSIPRPDIFDQADNEAKTRGIAAIPGAEPIEFTSNRDLGTTVTIGLPYPASLEEAIVNNLAIFYLDEVSTRWIISSGCRTDPSKRSISADVDSFSIYKVMAQAATHLHDVIVYPNPFIPAEAHGGCLKFINLTHQAKIRIYSLTGDLVWSKEIQNSGGAAQWYGKNDKDEPVASGIYLYIVTSPDRDEATGKISVIR